MSREAYAAVAIVSAREPTRASAISGIHQSAIERNFAPVLFEVVENQEVTADTARLMDGILRVDHLARSFDEVSNDKHLQDVRWARANILRRAWRPLCSRWRDLFPDSPSPSIVDLWQLYIPLSLWIARQKRRYRPQSLYVVGLNGSPGTGKTVLSSALEVVLNEILEADSEGYALAHGGDHWYLGKAARDALRKQGYEPERPGVSNRAVPGTHDLPLLTRNLSELEASTPHSTTHLPKFDKLADDRLTEHLEVSGKIGILLFDLWFAGANTDVDPARLPAGLQRRVAASLRDWSSVFKRIDALWAYEWPDFAQIVDERIEQERTSGRADSRDRMDVEDVKAFMSYAIERAWDGQTTSPVPPPENVTFYARRDRRYRVVDVRRGLRGPHL